jgi:hypothetical protein
MPAALKWSRSLDAALHFKYSYIEPAAIITAEPDQGHFHLARVG